MISFVQTDTNANMFDTDATPDQVVRQEREKKPYTSSWLPRPAKTNKSAPNSEEKCAFRGPGTSFR